MIGFVFKQKDLRTEPRSGALAHAFVVSNYLLIAKNMLITGSAALYQMNSLLNLLIAGISVYMYLRAVIVAERHIRFTACQIAVVGGLGLFWLVSFLLNTDLLRYSYVREELTQFIIYALPALLFLPTLRNCSNLMKYFYRYRWAMLAAATLSVVMILISGEIQGAGSRYAVYSMAFGRAVMFVCVVFLSSLFAKFNWRDLVGSVLCVAYILAFGSRFPLLCIGCFVIWKLLRSVGSLKNLLNSKWRWWLLAGLVAIVALLLFWKSIFGAVHGLLLLVGINSRTIELMASGDLATIIYDSGRREIYEALLAKVNLSPIFGYGAGGSNVVLENGLSHSFVFDVFGNMGYVFGGIFLLASVYALFTAYRVRKHKSDRAFMDICLCLFVPICLIQTSLWRASNFWMLVALYVGMKDSKFQYNFEIVLPRIIQKVLNVAHKEKNSQE